MTFAIYVLRSDPDFAIFDRALPGGGLPPSLVDQNDWDCAAVFETQDKDAVLCWLADDQGKYDPGHVVLCVNDSYMLKSAQAILCGDYTDSNNNGATAKIEVLWQNPKYFKTDGGD